MTIYKNIKQQLTNTAKEAKQHNRKDKAYCRYVINNAADEGSRQLDWYAMKGKLTEKQAEQRKVWLHSHAANLHP